jgi:nitrous oxidase accessory protein NosD
MSIKGSTTAGIRIWAWSGNPIKAVVEDNTISVNSTAENAIWLDYVTNGVIAGNKASGAAGSGAYGYGLYMYHCTYCQVTRNDLVATAGGAGIGLSNSSSNHIAWNTCKGYWYGIELMASPDASNNYNSIDWNFAQSTAPAGTGILFATGNSQNVYSYNRTPGSATGISDLGSSNTNGGGNF